MLKECASNKVCGRGESEIKIYAEQKLRSMLEETKNKKDYFMMSDLK